MLFLIKFIIVFVPLFFAASIIIKKWKNSINKPIKVVIFFIAIVAAKVIASVPIENLVLTYGSMDEAFSYIGKGDMLGYQDGENSCLIISEKKSEHEYLYLNRVDNELKAPFFEPSKRMKILDKNYSLWAVVIEEKDTDNYYAVLSVSKSQIENFNDDCIQDSKNSVFKKISYADKDKDEHFGFYSAYVEKPDADYTARIGEKEYRIFDD